MESAADRERRIVEVLLALLPGEVVTYGDVAVTAGFARHARLVGRILRTTEVEVPWWRVVNATGRLVPGAESEQAGLLRAEGVVVDVGRVRRAPTGRFARPPDVPGAVRRRVPAGRSG